MEPGGRRFTSGVPADACRSRVEIVESGDPRLAARDLEDRFCCPSPGLESSGLVVDDAAEQRGETIE